MWMQMSETTPKSGMYLVMLTTGEEVCSYFNGHDFISVHKETSKKLVLTNQVMNWWKGHSICSI